MVDAEVLLQAYHYLSSAIAQAFAALIALTAMFYIYRRGVLRSRIKSTVESMIPFIDLIDNESKSILTPGKLTDHLKLLYGKEVVEFAKKQLDDPKVAKRRLRESRDFWGKRLKAKVNYYEDLITYSRGLSRYIYPSILLSALTMGFGIISLLAGPLISRDLWRWVVMLGESSFALLALGYTLKAVIKMVSKPEESKEKLKEE
ncbi:hypothetical protein CEE36_05525 [candidate division TA06 bacterium B3_TA06]|uniref:Uncharacterized protein n=1 Tax=candidate division TA06 bacterium B3_TA06 TaxID=2012487 RepID=A0A532V7K8_UNCT6|nr:MAG: hypothetical protein CEE36_05525 [candidate division TA06 bacterium B3_TA06]